MSLGYFHFANFQQHLTSSYKLSRNNTLIRKKITFSCRLPFWQRHIVLPVSQKTCHQKFVFKGSFVLKYFIELKSVNPKNSVFLSLSLSIYIYICHNFHINILPASFLTSHTSFVPSFLKIHISFNF